MAVISTGLVPKAMAPGLAASGVSSAAPAGRRLAPRQSSKAIRALLAGHNDGGPAFIADSQPNAYGPPMQQASARQEARPIGDVLGRIEKARQDADEAFR